MKIKISSNKLTNTSNLLQQWTRINPEKKMKQIGEESVQKLMEASPVKTGEFRAGWGYIIEKENDNTVLTITNNSHPDVHPSLAYLLEFGHGGKFGYIAPKNFIIPTMNGEYDKIEDEWGDVLAYGKYK